MNVQPRELVMLTQAEQMLARATTIDEVKDIRDRAEAARGYARKIGLSRDITVHAAAIKVQAERKLGQLLKETDLAVGAAGNQYTGKYVDRSHDATGPIRLSDLGISKSESSRAQQIASLPAPAFDRYVKSCIESRQEPTTAGLLRLVVGVKSEGKMVVRVKGLTGEFEWYTPREYLDAAIEVMGGIDLDPASSDLAQRHVKAKRFYTIGDDGRQQAWAGRVFLNPPYAMPYIKQFAEKMAQAWADREIDAGIMLVNNATDTAWFHKLLNCCAAVCLTRGRISFLEATNGEAIEKRAPTQGQAFFYFGSDVPTFARVFSKFGKVLLAYSTAPLGDGTAKTPAMPAVARQGSPLNGCDHRIVAKNTLSFACSKTMKYLRTPKEIWERLSSQFQFTVDACASDANHLLDRYWTEKEDGLKQDWSGEVVYCHPLFDGKIGRWVEKAATSRCTTVLLLPAATHTKYFHDYIYGNPRCTVEFLKKPVRGFRFGHDDGTEDDLTRIGYIKPLMIVVFRND